MTVLIHAICECDECDTHWDPILDDLFQVNGELQVKEECPWCDEIMGDN